MDEIDKLLAAIESSESSPAPIKPPNSVVTSSIDDLLSHVKADQAKPVSVKPVSEDQKSKRLQQLKIQRQELCRSNAQKWLNSLSLESEEGRWFEEFACNYESLLDAAIDYLEALEEAQS